MKKILSWVSFTRKEKLLVGGIIVLVSCIVLIPFWVNSKKEKAVVQYQALAAAMPTNNKYTSGKFGAEAANKSTVWKLQKFDMNTVTEQQLVAMGFREKLAHTFINYRNKGGRFYKWADVEKIYGLRAEEKAAIEPYLLFPEKASYGNKGFTSKFTKTISPVSINTASQADWEQLPGIGPYFAARIIKYRNAKGGFTSVDDISKTYGLAPETFEKIKPYLVLDAPPNAGKTQTASKVNSTLVNINTATEKQLLQVPNMDEAVAKAIIITRQRNGKFSSVADIKRIPFVTETAWQLLQPYLTVD